MQDKSCYQRSFYSLIILLLVSLLAGTFVLHQRASANYTRTPTTQQAGLSASISTIPPPEVDLFSRSLHMDSLIKGYYPFSNKQKTTNIRITDKAAALLDHNNQITGFCLGMHANTYQYDYTLLLKEIKETGSDWVSIHIKFYQPNWQSDTILIPPPNAPIWKQLNKTLKAAKQQNLNVLLFPIVLLENPGEDHWRGNIAPKNRLKWYKNYTYLLLKMGQIADKQQVDMLCVGSEFCSMQQNTQIWIQMIRKLRAIYKGALIYSTNWDALDDLHFDSELDFLGVSAYFPLSESNDPSVEEMTASWKNIKSYLLGIQAKRKIPLILTELGYASINGTNKTPWDYTSVSKIDLQEQVDCYQAFSNCWKDEKDFYGVYFYDWFGVGGCDDRGYTLRGKPALEVAKQWFR